MLALMGPGVVLMWLGFGWLMTLANSVTMAEMFSGMGGDASLPVLYLLAAFVPFFSVGLIAFMNAAQDEVRKWAYFTASHPKGIRGAIYSKYVMMLIMLMTAYVSSILAAELAALAEHLICGTENEQILMNMQLVQLLCNVLFFFYLFKVMIDMPFTFRFGQKNGEQRKVLTFCILALGGLIWLLFGPLPGGDDGDPFVAFYDWCVSFASGTLKHNVYLILGILLWLTIIGYYVSYKISCKVYMKGVEQYAK